MLTPTIETERVILRPLKTSDAEKVFNNWTNDPEVSEYTLWSVHNSLEDTVEWLTMEENNLANPHVFNWGFVLKETRELFGSGGVSYNREQKMFEIGYVLMKKYWKKGLATEVAQAFVDFSVNELKQTALFGRHAKENVFSGKVMEKIGFVYRNDGVYTSFDGKRTFDSREYKFHVK